MTDQRFAQNLKAARERAGMSQQDVADKMGEYGYPMHQQTVARVEAGTRTVRGPGELLAFSRAVSSHVDALVRPAGLQAEATRLLDTARAVRDAREAASSFESSVRYLNRLIERAEQAGHIEALDFEIGIAREALRDRKAGGGGAYR